MALCILLLWTSGNYRRHSRKAVKANAKGLPNHPSMYVHDTWGAVMWQTEVKLLRRIDCGYTLRCQRRSSYLTTDAQFKSAICSSGESVSHWLHSVRVGPKNNTVSLVWQKNMLHIAFWILLCNIIYIRYHRVCHIELVQSYIVLFWTRLVITTTSLIIFHQKSVLIL